MTLLLPAAPEAPSETPAEEPEVKAATLEMIVSQGGIVGWTAETDAVVKALA